jgi:hypothetical protein
LNGRVSLPTISTSYVVLGCNSWMQQKA